MDGRRCGVKILKTWKFLSIFDKILVAIQDNVELKSQHLNLTAKEKLTEDDVQSYKYWLFEHDREDCFENLVDWVEMKVHIMDEAQEEAGGDSKGGGTRTENRRNNRLFNTGKRARGCVVENCQEDHPPWVLRSI